MIVTDMLDWLKTEIQWMYWTWPSAIFFLALFLSITGLTIWDKYSPSLKRKGFLPISTTRGDRFFIGIISTIGLILFWLWMFGTHYYSGVLLLAAIWNIFVARRG